MKIKVEFIFVSRYVNDSSKSSEEIEALVHLMQAAINWATLIQNENGSGKHLGLHAILDDFVVSTMNN